MRFSQKTKMNGIINKRNTLIKKLKQDVCSIYDLLKELGQDEFNKTSKFKWKYIDDGYSGRGSIFDSSRKKFRERNKYILIYNIEYTEDYKKFFELKDDRIFEAINEANLWIEERLVFVKSQVNNFNIFYKENSDKIQENVRIYKELEKYLGKDI